MDPSSFQEEEKVVIDAHDIVQCIERRLQLQIQRALILLRRRSMLNC